MSRPDPKRFPPPARMQKELDAARADLAETERVLADRREREAASQLAPYRVVAHTGDDQSQPSLTAEERESVHRITQEVLAQSKERSEHEQATRQILAQFTKGRPAGLGVTGW